MSRPRMLITGAAGFIGNAACRRYRDEFDVIAVDDLSRGKNVPEGVLFVEDDAGRIPGSLFAAFDVVLHLAAQVSVVASIKDPGSDFYRNTGLTFALARWAAQMPKPPVFIYSSTNKVYGPWPRDGYAVHDNEPIAPSTPYGISKATGGMYVREFLPDTGYDFRQSCIYGEDQAGSEDQGWIGWIRSSIRDGRPITCFGDGTQVRDLLHVDDLLDAYTAAISRVLRAGSYTVGGGLTNTISFKQAVQVLGGSIANWESWRKDDQRYFVAAADGLRARGWKPKVSAWVWLNAQRSKIGLDRIERDRIERDRIEREQQSQPEKGARA